jgi:hypothetical protein
MNRSILIVICDFLLVSLLVFSSVDINQVAKDGRAQTGRPEMVTNRVDGADSDLTEVMRLALDEERKNREQLLSELEKNRDTLEKQQVLLSEREKQSQAIKQELQESEKQAQATQQELREREKQARAIQQALEAREKQSQILEQQLQEREKQAQALKQELQGREQQTQQLQAEQTKLQQQFVLAQTNLQTLSQQLQYSSTDALISKERLAAMEAELRKRAEEAAALQQRLGFLAQSNQVILSEKQQLAGKLQVAEVEKRHATEQVVAMKEQVQVERQEKAKLAEGFQTLAAKSGELSQEIRENRALTPNTIYEEFTANRVRADFAAVLPGSFDPNKSKNTGTVLVTDGTNTYAVCHIENTVLTLENPGTEWGKLSGTLERDMAAVPVHALSFHLQDPRIVFMPVSPAEARKLGAQKYPISTSPFKFQDAVLVGAVDSYYGECRFEIDPNTSAYVKLNRGQLKGLFGKFNPSRGDLVFSKTGDLLGIMANSSYCLLIHNFDASATIQFSSDVRPQRTDETLETLCSFVQRMPARLQ